jgi:hypothetical protein
LSGRKSGRMCVLLGLRISVYVTSPYLISLGSNVAELFNERASDMRNARADVNSSHLSYPAKSSQHVAASRAILREHLAGRHI